jgi:flagellar motor switch protein FliN/FliY
MEPNSEELFSAMDIDAIGEILNISLGSSATSVSELLEQRVNITTPQVEVLSSSEVHFESMEPAIAVEINYVSGLSGKNILVLKESDVQVIVGLLLHTDYSDQTFEMDEMSIGAICEVMNLMMGASATALSQFLNRAINISPPTSFQIDNSEQFKSKYFHANEPVVTVKFNLMIGDLVNSEFISLLTVDLAKELISTFSFDAPAEEAPPPPEPERPPVAKPVPRPVPKPVPQAPPQPVRAQAPPARPANDFAAKQEPQKSYNVESASYQNFDEDAVVLSDDQSNNLNMIMSVPLQITVEIGRTSKPIKDILDFTSGTIVELDKQAGSQIDVFVNGKRIAKGDVVVVDDFYGVRITEVLSNEIMKLI